MRTTLFLVFGFAFLVGCNFSKHDGYSITSSGLHYKYNFIGDGEKTPVEGDYIQFSIVVSTMNDSVLYTNNRSAMGMAKWVKFNNSVKGAVQEALGMMIKGDSLSLIVESENMKLEPFAFAQFIPEGEDIVKAELVLTQHLNAKQYAEYQKRMAWKADDEMNEQIALKQFLRDNEIDENHFLDGIYYINHKKGKGPKAESGKSLLVHYKAGFLDGTPLDDTYFLDRPLEVRLGDPGQMLPGFEIGIRQMHQGGHATFIIPSLFAFGENGSTNGSVKPFQTIIYEVELVRVF